MNRYKKLIPKQENGVTIYREESTKVSRAGRVAQAEEHLLSKCEALNSNPSATKKTHKKSQELEASVLQEVRRAVELNRYYRADVCLRCMVVHAYNPSTWETEVGG
jgi:hypothetical protein